MNTSMRLLLVVAAVMFVSSMIVSAKPHGRKGGRKHGSGDKPECGRGPFRGSRGPAACQLSDNDVPLAERNCTHGADCTLGPLNITIVNDTRTVKFCQKPEEPEDQPERLISEGSVQDMLLSRACTVSVDGQVLQYCPCHKGHSCSLGPVTVLVNETEHEALFCNDTATDTISDDDWLKVLSGPRHGKPESSESSESSESGQSPNSEKPSESKESRKDNKKGEQGKGRKHGRRRRQ